MDDDEIVSGPLDHLFGGDDLGGVKPYRRTPEEGREVIDTSGLTREEAFRKVSEANAALEQQSQVLRKAANDSERWQEGDNFEVTLLKMASRSLHKGAKEMSFVLWLAKRKDNGDDLSALIAGIEAKDVRQGRFLREVAQKYKLLD